MAGHKYRNDTTDGLASIFFATEPVPSGMNGSGALSQGRAFLLTSFPWFFDGVTIAVLAGGLRQLSQR